MLWAMKLRPIGVVLALYLIGSAGAQIIPPAAIDWQGVRDRQPEGVSLKLELPKTTYRQGESIPATLTYANTSATPYHIWASSGDSSGRIPDIAFYAKDAAGVEAADPLRWYFECGGVGGGLGNVKDLGDWKITLAVNQWLNFAQPGTYQLFAYSNRVKAGDRFARGNPQEGKIELVSDPVTVTINPMTPKEEEDALAEARTKLAAGGQEAAQAATALRYLGTPASRTEVIPLLNGPNAFEATLALYAAPDPAAEAPRILEAVRSGKLKLNESVIGLYTTLKSSGIKLPTTPPSKEEMEALRQKFLVSWKAAKEEITAAGVTATGGKGPEYNQTLILTMYQDPEKRAQARAELVKVQLELTPEQAGMILESWSDFGGEDFLPMVRKAVGEPAYNSDALKALAKLKPEEARALVVEDIQRPSPRYLVPKAASSIANGPLLSLPAGPIPELEPFFREQLAKESPPRLDLLMAAINRYGTPALLPEVIKFYSPKEGKWACSIQTDVLRFWIRCDSPPGLEALKRALASRESTHCYSRVLSEVLDAGWVEGALPMVTGALDDPDPEVTMSAIRVLEEHADGKWLGPSIGALQRVAGTITKQNAQAFYPLLGTVQTLQRSARWKPDAEQKEQLQALAVRRPQ